jgi:hypothetical protein
LTLTLGLTVELLQVIINIIASHLDIDIRL